MSEGEISIILIFTKENSLNSSETLESKKAHEKNFQMIQKRKKKSFPTKIITATLLKVKKMILKK